jgi:hypothetical protein
MNSNDPIARLAAAKLMISCQSPGCVQVFRPSLEHPGNAPVEAWAIQMGNMARDDGWGASPDGAVMCPEHRMEIPWTQGAMRLRTKFARAAAGVFFALWLTGFLLVNFVEASPPHLWLAWIGTGGLFFFAILWRMFRQAEMDGRKD